MTFPALHLPPLSPWLQQLAGILPLCALVEFIDVATKLHIFELNRSVPIWNWPVSPVSARLLLSNDRLTADDACYLDQVGHSPLLHCIDGRYGDCYPSSTQATTRLCIAKPSVCTWVPNSSPNLADSRARKQKLEVISLKRLDQPRSENRKKAAGNCIASIYDRLSRRRRSQRSATYGWISAIGWVFWTGATMACFMSRLYIAGMYLLLMPLTGFLISFTHGGKPRRLLDERPSPFIRLVVATSSLNGTNWLAFYGESHTINSLLNKPLVRMANTSASWPLQLLLRVLIGGQWALAVGSCALQDWNALVVSFWIVFCACIASYAYPPEKAARDWLQFSCNHVVESTSAEFSSRRSMLAALIFLNPESKERLTDWINPILADCPDRRAWESALFSFKELGILSESDPKVFLLVLIREIEGIYTDPTDTEQYWWKYIGEGLQMGERIEKVIQGRKEDRKCTV
ncbi:hypothetical protein MMC21_007177 [Puttea exsequens]|nr:hypothetical protein [Puttea exsequens]